MSWETELLFTSGLALLWGVYCGFWAHVLRQSALTNLVASLLGVIVIEIYIWSK